MSVPPLDSAPRSRAAPLALGGLLLVAVVLAGSSGLESPWMQGDESIFIKTNPEVTGGLTRGVFDRLALIFRYPPAEDLYQPVPILTYAVQWAAAPGETWPVRMLDVLLHALNGILFWTLLVRVVRTVTPAPVGGAALDPVLLLTWCLALLWTLHPALVTTWASDMGRTHLLAATFCLLALLLHLRALDRELAGHTAAGWGWFAGSLALLLGAMLSKAAPGWVLVVVALEAWRLGWRRTLVSARVYVVLLLCAVFAASTLYTSRESGLIDDAAQGLFGDPVARSALAVWLYVRNLLAPLWISPWYLPDPQTAWTYPLVWVGLLLALGSLAVAGLAARGARATPGLVGWAWCWGLLLPVIGLVGAREAAAVDRYMYQPLMGLLLVAALGLAPRIAQARLSAGGRLALLAPTVVLAVAMLLSDLGLVELSRSTLQRALRVSALNPGDPRAAEGLAQAYRFAATNPIPRVDQALLPDDKSQQFPYFVPKFLEKLADAAANPRLDYYYPVRRAAFHRRTSYAYYLAGDYQHSLRQAQEAARFEPDAPMTLRRLAQAFEALGMLREAFDAYAHCEKVMPADVKFRAGQYTYFADFLLDDLNDPQNAAPRYIAAIQTGVPDVELRAKTGLALCEIRAGQGIRGYNLLREVRGADPTYRRALDALAEYYLRSAEFADAARVYASILARNPADYDALRGFFECCLATDNQRAGVAVWDDAITAAGSVRELESFRVWALACADEPAAAAQANRLLQQDENNPLACLSHMLLALRRGDVSRAIEWIDRGAQGEPLVDAREFERAEAAVLRFVRLGRLPEEGLIVVAYLARGLGRVVDAVGALNEFIEFCPESGWLEMATHMRDELSDLAELLLQENGDF